MKLASTLFGVIVAQEGSGTYDDYGEDAERGSSYVAPPSYNPVYETSYSSGYGRSSLTVKAVTCWESNNMGTHGATNPDQHSHEGDAPSDTDKNRDPYGWLNIHENHAVATEVHNAHSLDAFDHRLSGCIYEASGFTYGADTYDHPFEVKFDANDDTGLSPVWFHYFNAHVLSGGTKATHKIVMANPTYEGLGYLNWIVTYVKSDDHIKADMTDAHINRADALHTDLYAADTEFTVTAKTDTNWYSTLESAKTTWAENIALSSFPQNDLGKDFRFNIRILHKMGEADQTEAIDSYYWYKVDKVVIVFPTTVGCNFDTMASADDGYFRCMDSASGSDGAGLGGHNSWVSDDDDHDDTTAKKYKEKFGTYVESSICAKSGTYANSASGTKMACGSTYTVTGLMNSYDEYAQQEYGTHQEFWFTFQYYYDPNPDFKNLCDGHEDYDCYQAPNHLFNAFEVTSVNAECSENNLKGNKCTHSGSSKSTETWS